MNPAILLIKSKQEKNNSMGTGFVIHQDNYGSYVLTCAHVINQVVEPIINGIEVEEKDIVSSKTIDLAVLYLKGLFQKPLKLQNRSCQGKDVQLMGYSGFTGDKYQGKLRDATILGDKITIEGTKDNTTYHAWQIIAKDNHEIERGNSGGPLVCQKSGKVIAVVSNHKGVHQGYAISIEHLQDIWDEMPPFLFESDDENESPFIGLSAFSIEQSHLFFGRDREISDIIKKLKKEDIIAVVGDSGSGKSSLIKAGVIPKYLNRVLDPEGNSKFHIINTRPARDPFTELSSSISDIGEEFNLDFQSIDQMKKAIKKRDSESILNALEYIFKQEENSHLLIYIDQFEELFTLCSDVMQKEFIEVLLHLLNTQSSKLKIQIIFTMRKDYYNLISEYETFFIQTQKNKYILRRMSNEQIKECIEKPLERTFINKEQISAFSKAVLNDMGDESSELALLQIALTQTWKHKKDFDNNLLRSYHEIGEVSGALSKLADDTWKILTPAEKQMLQYIFIRIVKPSDTGGIIRRLADRDEFSDEKWCLAQKLASALDSQGNIASDKNARLGRILTIKGQEGKVVELTHEALVRQWPMYQRWLKEVSKNNLKRIHDDVIDKNKIYQQHKKSKFLLMGYELEESLKLLDDEYKGYLSESEIAFIETSAHSRNMIRFWKRSTVVVLVLLVVLSGYLVYKADRERDKAEELSQKLVKVAGEFFGKGLDVSQKKEYSDLEIYQFIVEVFKSSDNHKMIELVKFSYNNMGVVYNRKQEYDKAIEALQESIAIDPKNYDVYHNMGLAYAGKKEYDKAIGAHQKAVAINSKRDAAYNDMGVAYAGKKEYDKAIGAYQKAIAINSKRDDVYYNMGVAYAGKKEYDKAIVAYQKAIAINSKNDSAYYNMGVVYNNKQEYDKAIVAYQKAVAIDPKKYNAYYNMGFAYINKQEYDKAIGAYQKAVAINSKNDSAYVHLFELQLIQNKNFDSKLEQQYIKLFQNDKMVFIHYEILKTLSKISKEKQVDLDKWKTRYTGVPINWSFDVVIKWAQKIENREIKANLLESLEIFKNNF